MAELRVHLSNEEVLELQTSIVVEMYDKVFGSFSRKRRMRERFGKKDIGVLKYWYPKFYSWHLVKGIPRSGVTFKPETLRSIKKIVHFFATV